MKCQKCQSENDENAYFCHQCGNKLRRKANEWRIFSVVLIILIIVLGILLFDCNETIHSLQYMNCDLQTELENSKSKQGDYETTIRKFKESQAKVTTLTNQIREKDRQISDLRKQLPETYYTKYSNQGLYYWKGGYKDTGYKHTYAGTGVTVYMQRDGYGLTDWGWIPMNCLRQ